MPQSVLDLPDQVLVSGAAGGIGNAVASSLTDAGCRVIGTDMRRAPPSWRGQGWIEADIADEAGREAIARAPVGELGGLVLAAGILDQQDWEAIEETTAIQLLSVNLLAPFFLTRRLLPRLAPDAAIVIVGSVAGIRASPATPFYGASKAALRNLAASMALLLQPRGIRINVVAPGLIDTPLTDALNKELARRRGVSAEAVAEERATAIPMGRAGEPSEVAGACLFLLSRQSAYMTGSTVFAAGGVLAGIT